MKPARGGRTPRTSGQLAQEAARGLRGPDQQRWRDGLESDLDNLRAALTWTLRDSAAPDDADTGLLLVGALWYFWFQRGFTGEARRWLERALASGAQSWQSSCRGTARCGDVGMAAG